MLEGKNVLIVEDEFLISQLLEDMLSDGGCTDVSIARNVSEALEEIDQKKPDLVILDLNLAGQSASPVASRLRDRQIPFIISSGYDADSLDAEWQKYPLLTKPFMPDAFRAKILQVLAVERL